MTVHSGCHGIFLIFLKCICRHCNDRDTCLLPIRQLPDRPCCFIAIHFRHLDIHEDHIIGIRRHFCYHVDTLNAIHHALCFQTGTLKDCLCNLRIQIIILCYKDIPAFQDFRACFRIFDLPVFIKAFICYFVFQRNSKGTALSELALYLYCSTKQVHISLYDGHSKSGSCNFTPCGVFLTGKGFENPCQIILTHTDSRIAYPGSHNHVSRLIAWQFLQAYRNRATGRSIFHGITQDIDKYLFYLGNIRQYMLMLYIHRVTKSNLLFPCFGIKNCKHRLTDIFNPAIALINLHFPALDPGHIKYIIYDGQKKLAGLLQFFQMFFCFRQVLFFQLLLHQLCIAQNDIHRSPDVMRHIVKETGLCETGLLCFFQGGFQPVIQLLCIICRKLCRSFCLPGLSQKYKNHTNYAECK